MMLKQNAVACAEKTIGDELLLATDTFNSRARMTTDHGKREAPKHIPRRLQRIGQK